MDQLLKNGFFDFAHQITRDKSRYLIDGLKLRIISGGLGNWLSAATKWLELRKFCNAETLCTFPKLLKDTASFDVRTSQNQSQAKLSHSKKAIPSLWIVWMWLNRVSLQNLRIGPFLLKTFRRTLNAYLLAFAEQNVNINVDPFQLPQRKIKNEKYAQVQRTTEQSIVAHFIYYYFYVFPEIQNSL